MRGKGERSWKSERVKSKVGGRSGVREKQKDRKEEWKGSSCDECGLCRLQRRLWDHPLSLWSLNSPSPTRGTRLRRLVAIDQFEAEEWH